MPSTRRLVRYFPPFICRREAVQLVWDNGLFLSGRKGYATICVCSVGALLIRLAKNSIGVRRA